MEDGNGIGEGHSDNGMPGDRHRLMSRIRLGYWPPRSEENGLEAPLCPLSERQVQVTYAALDGVGFIRDRLALDKLLQFVGEPFPWHNRSGQARVWVHVPIAARWIIVEFRPEDGVRELVELGDGIAQVTATTLARYDLARARRWATAYRPFEESFLRPPLHVLNAANNSDRVLRTALEFELARASEGERPSLLAAIRELER